MFYLHGFMGSAEDFDFFPESFHNLSYIDVPLIVSLSKQWRMLGAHLWHQVGDQDSISVFGYSMGGRLALAMLDLYPDRIKRLVLCGSQFRPPENSRQRNKVDRERASLLKKDFEGFLDDWSRLPIFGPQESEAWTQLRKRRIERMKITSALWSDLLRTFSVSAQPDYSELIKTHADKVQFIYGENDKKYEGFAKDYRSLGVQTFPVSNAWHAVHLDNPEGLLSAFDSLT